MFKCCESRREYIKALAGITPRAEEPTSASTVAAAAIGSPAPSSSSSLAERAHIPTNPNNTAGTLRLVSSALINDREFVALVVHSRLG